MRWTTLVHGIVENLKRWVRIVRNFPKILGDPIKGLKIPFIQNPNTNQPKTLRLPSKIVHLLQSKLRSKKAALLSLQSHAQMSAQTHCELYLPLLSSSTTRPLPEEIAVRHLRRPSPLSPTARPPSLHISATHEEPLIEPQ